MTRRDLFQRRLHPRILHQLQKIRRLLKGIRDVLRAEHQLYRALDAREAGLGVHLAVGLEEVDGGDSVLVLVFGGVALEETGEGVLYEAREQEEDGEWGK